MGRRIGFVLVPISVKNGIVLLLLLSIILNRRLGPSTSNNEEKKGTKGFHKETNNDSSFVLSGSIHIL